MNQELERQKTEAKRTIYRMSKLLAEHAETLDSLPMTASPRLFAVQLEVIEDAAQLIRKKLRILEAIKLAEKNL